MNESKPTCGWNESRPPIIHGREEYNAVVRDAEIRGATWALERTLIHNYIGQSTRDKDIAESASRIVDARRKEK
jgi:hypothetical protein